MVDKWRKAVFGDTRDDPIPQAVSFAIESFGREKDRKIWTWYANRIGINTFLEFVYEVRSCVEQHELRDPAAAFHKRLKSVLPKGGAK